jgi:uncharacterized membrane protein YhdT
VKQQHWEQKEINKTLHLLPDWAVQGCVAADQIAAQDQGKIRKKELGEIHWARITECAKVFGAWLSPAVSEVKSTGFVGFPPHDMPCFLPIMFDLLRSFINEAS